MMSLLAVMMNIRPSIQVKTKATHKYECVCVYVCMYVCICIYIYIYICLRVCI